MCLGDFKIASTNACRLQEGGSNIHVPALGVAGSVWLFICLTQAGTMYATESISDTVKALTPGRRQLREGKWHPLHFLPGNHGLDYEVQVARSP